MTKEREKDDIMNDPQAFRQRVRLAAVQVEGLRPEELAAALAYEVEPFSGITADVAEVRYKPVEEDDPSVRVYDVAVRRRVGRRIGRGDLGRWLRPALVVGALILLLVGADFAWQSWHLSHLGRIVARQGILDSQVSGIRTVARQKREEARLIREGRQSMERAQAEVAQLRSAYREILAEIATACGERAVVESMAGGPRQIVLRAAALSADAAAETMSILSTRGATCGWILEPGPIAVHGTGPLTTFECVLNHD